jgi:ABC-type multidrug transport system fused ATPase/permease subunit
METSRHLLGPLRRLMRERATLLITHDLELAAAADEVVVLEAGRVVQRGAPAALDAQGGPWARLRGAPALEAAA